MAQSFVTDSGTLVIPQAAASIKVQQGSSGLSTTGVLMLVGEADAGPDYSLEDELGDNAFGADQLGDVLAKYKSGPLVDAFRVFSVPANDPDITGSPSRFVLVKTNPSTRASGPLDAIGGGFQSGGYGSLYDKSHGRLGNLIYYTVEQKTAEVKPTTSSFTYIPPVGGANINLRVNGAAAVAYTVAANQTPTAFVSGVEALAGVDATGGADRLVIQAARVADASTIAVAAPGGNVVTVTISTAWSVTPTAGDTMVIPSGSAIAGAANANVGAYVITAATATVITATKLSDAGKGGAVAGVITAPVAVGATDITSTSADMVGYTPVTITLTGSTILNGVGKTLEINQLTSGADLFERCAFVLGTTTAVTWLSKTGSPKLLTSAAEYAVTLKVNRQLDNVQEELSAGGQIAFKLGYTGTSCAVVVSSTTMTLTPVGGSGAAQTITLKDFPTIADLVAYINSKTGYIAAVGTATLGQMSPLALDEGTYAAGTDFGNYTLRLKMDAVKFFTVIQENSVLVQFGADGDTPAVAGLPQAMTTASTYLTGGAKGATTNTVFNAAVDALENVKGNFLVPLFSRDAADDITDELTESGSTYTIANINAYAKTHVIKMSTLKRKKNRQAFLSLRDTFANAQDAASNLASFRCSLTFQDVKAIGNDGLDQFQPWGLAGLAAGMQAAGFYRAIFNKGINCSGVLSAEGDFKDSNDTNVEDALLAGLLVARKSDDGGFRFASDQTTYSKDNNFVYNSIQAVYAADTIALTTAERMQKAFVGQSIADINAALALSALEGIMADMLRLKLIAPSDDAPKGFKNASIKISGTTMVVSLEIKLAGAIYFIPINFLVSQVTQAASS